MSVPETLHERHIQTIADIQARAQSQRSALERASDVASAFVGSVPFVVIHGIWFVVWIGMHAAGWAHFDPYPFTFLAFIVGVEAIVLTSVVMISQRHNQQQARLQAALDLQINLLAEREMTKVLTAVRSIAVHLGLKDVYEDPEAQEMERTTDVESLMKDLDRVDPTTPST